MTAPSRTSDDPALAPVCLPRLREDLRMVRQTDASPGSDTRLFYDPLRHRYLRIDAESFDILSLWHEHDQAEPLAAAVNDRFARAIDAAKVEVLADFLKRAELTIGGTGGDTGWPAAWRRQESQRQHWVMHVVHSYLFFRVPLMSPDRWLAATLPYVRPLMSRAVFIALLVLGLIGLYLVSRQWEAFVGTYHHVFTPAGALALGLVTILVKALHECGHAYVAASYGCRVPTVGVAFMVMVPLLYTDVTDAWRLADRRSRMRIDAAGIVVEIALASLALFAWPFLPEGPAKTAAFLVATASLLMTLGLNLNPFMRFDGYYLLADLWRMENLQPRAFALGRWRLREMLFAPGATCPEALPSGKRRLLVAYAWATWTYRLVTFTGIALLVYQMFFKALGIVLFAIEIVFFIALPVARELGSWWKLRAHLWRTRRAAMTAMTVVGLGCMLFVPWSTRIDVPAILEWREPVRLYPVRAARIGGVQAAQGQDLPAGAEIVTLEGPEIASQITQIRTRLDVTRLRLARRMADTQDREQSLVLEDEMRSLQTRLHGFEQERALLTMRMPVSGRLLELNPALHAGRWVSKTEPIATIGKPGHWIVRGYLGAADVRRVSVGALGSFVAHETLLRAVEVALGEISQAGAASIDLPELMSVHGGAIAVEEDRMRRLVPVSAQFLVTLVPVGTVPPVDRIVRGTVMLHGDAESFAARAWRQVVMVLVREMGF